MTHATEKPPAKTVRWDAFSCLLLTKAWQPRGIKFFSVLARTKHYVAQNQLVLSHRGRTGNRLADIEETIREVGLDAGIKAGSVLLLDFLPIAAKQVAAMAEAIEEALSTGLVVHNLANGQIYRSNVTPAQRTGLVEALTTMAREYEASQKRSQRAAQSWNKRRQHSTGEPVTKRLPGWLHWDEETGKIVAIPERAKVIKHIYELAQTGSSTRQIAATLEREKALSWGSSQHWTASYVDKLLKNPAVVGDYIPQTSEGRERIPAGEVWSGYFPTVISRDQWNYIQNLRVAKPHGRPAKHRINNLFPGLLWLGDSVRRITVLEKGKPEWTYLVCDPPAGETQRTHLNYLKFENNFLEFVRELDWVSLAKTRPEVTRDPQHQAAEHQREQLENRLRRFLKTAGNDTQPPNELVQRIREVRAELKAVTAEITAKEGRKRARAVAKSELAWNIEQFKKLVTAGDETSRAGLREHIRHLIERIEVYPEGLDELPHLENTRGFPVFRILFRSGAVKSILTNDAGEMVAVLDEPAA